MSDKKISLKAHAKFNLLFTIKGKRADGFHDLEMVNTELELHDIVEIEEIEQIEAVEARCVARLVVTPEKMREIVEVMGNNFQIWQAKFATPNSANLEE